MQPEACRACPLPALPSAHRQQAVSTQEPVSMPPSASKTSLTLAETSYTWQGLGGARAHPAGLKALRRGISGRCKSCGRQAGIRPHGSPVHVYFAEPGPLMPQMPKGFLAPTSSPRPHYDLWPCHHADTCPGTDELCLCPRGKQPSWTSLAGVGKRGGPRGRGSARLLQECADLMGFGDREGSEASPQASS